MTFLLALFALIGTKNDFSPAAWQRQISDYRPDYSDSSALLEPKAGNRFATPWLVATNGVALCDIVVAQSQSDDTCLRQAAVELQRHIALLTGVTLKIRDGWMAHSETRPLARHICLGKRLIPSYRDSGWFAEDGWSEKLAKIGFTDGYGIATSVGNWRGQKSERLHVFGVTSKGVMNGVMALIENNTDLIWARPDETIGTIYTERKELAFVWGEGVVEVPATRGRGWNSYGAIEWMAHNRCNVFNGGGGGDIEYTNPKKERFGVLYKRHLGGHNIQHFFHGVTDKRCFPRGSNDERLSSNFWFANPCFTSPVCLENFVSNLLNCARMQSDGPGKIYVNTQDTWDECQCPGCTAPITLPDGRVVKPEDGNFRSTQFWLFMNAAGRALAKEMPEKGIVSLAYFFTAPPPAVKLEPNVWPEFAPYVRSNDKAPLTAPENALWLERLKGWHAHCKKEIEFYDYYGLGLAFPRPLAEVRQWDFQMTAPYLQYFTSETPAIVDRAKDGSDVLFDVSAMEYWVLTRLYWDPTEDVEKLRKYFIRRTYRNAAPEIERVYGAIREEWYKSPRASTLGDNPLDLAKLLVVDTGRAAEVSNFLAKASAKPNHPKSSLLARRLERQLMKFVTEAANLKNPSAQLPLVRTNGMPGFDDDVWTRAADLGDFVKITKERNIPAANPVELRMFHDSDNIHLRIRCSDPAMAERKVPTPPDGAKEFIPSGDHVEIYVSDPLEDGSYYLFSVSPDGYTADFKGYDEEWNALWQHRVRKTEKGWETVVTLPLKAINAKNDKGNRLKFLALRQLDKHGTVERENTSWGGGGWHQFAKFGDIRLLR